MTQEQAFLRAISAAPDDDAPRLIFADWLEERCDPRGEFIRIQCCLASMPEDDRRRPTLQEREYNLLNQHRATWEGPLRQICKVASITFQHGFPETIGISSAAFLTQGDQLFALAPIRGLDLVDIVSRGDMAAIAASPHLKNLTTLNLRGNYIRDEGVQALAASPHLKNLTTLYLGYNRIGTTGVQALATAGSAILISSPP
jgi:uncharacterized protein (TIGR02996 family)